MPDDQIGFDLGDLPGRQRTSYYKMWRGWMDHALFGGEKYCRRAAWCWLIEHAKHSDRRFNNHGALIVIKRGQLCYSFQELADAWGWSKGSVRRFVARLKTDTMIGTATGTGRMLITIYNYDLYQSADQPTGTAGVTPTGTAAAQQRPTTQEGKNLKKDSIRPKSDYAFKGRIIRLTQPDFEKWQAAYSAIPDLRAELTVLDDFYHQELRGADRKKWFVRCSAALGKKHQQRLADASVNGHVSHQAQELETWQVRLTGFRDSGFWLDIWGFPPNDPDTRVPRELLDAGDQDQAGEGAVQRSRLHENGHAPGS